jgi:8-hydroxy-5-deazaflavin:NADPH oxidoreductase
MSDIAIIGGTGNQGYGLALRWALAGRSIVIGSRDAERAVGAAEKIRQAVAPLGRDDIQVEGLENGAAAAAAAIVVVCVPLAAQIGTIKAIKDHIALGSILVDVTVPLATAIGGRASRMLGLPAGSAAEQLAEYAPAGVQVVSAFHFLSADLLAEVGPDGPIPLDCDVVGCGGDPRAQEVLRDLALAIDGVRYTHAGPLVASRLVEATATLLIAINVRHKSRHTGMRLTGV